MVCWSIISSVTSTFAMIILSENFVDMEQSRVIRSYYVRLQLGDEVKHSKSRLSRSIYRFASLNLLHYRTFAVHTQAQCLDNQWNKYGVVRAVASADICFSGAILVLGRH